MGPMWTCGVSAGGGLGQGLPYVPRDIVPKFPVECPPYVYIAWERRFEVFIANQGLRHTISPEAPGIAVISCINDAYLFGHFGEALVTDHRRVWGYISEATAGAPLGRVLCLYRRRMLRLCELTWRECSGKRKPLKQQNGNMRRSWRGFGGKGRWAYPSTDKVVIIQLIVEELLLRLWVPCGHVG